MADTAPSSFIAAAVSLAPQIRASAEEGERSRRLPMKLVEAMAQAGFFRLWIPRSLSGEETDAITLVRVVEEVSRADGAAGWCLANGGEYGAFGGYLPHDAAREIYGSDPHVRTAGSLRPSGNCRGGRGRLSRHGKMATGKRLSAFRLDHSRLPDSRTGTGRASEPMAPLSCASCFSPPLRAKSSTLGTVSGCAAREATITLLPTFSYRLSVRSGFAIRRWNGGRFMRFRRSRCSAPCSRRCRSASPATRSIF